jgi:hypothetical protein
MIFLFPIVFDFKLFGFSKRKLSEKIFGILLISIGIVGGIIGTFDAISILIEDFRTGVSHNKGH